MISLNYQINREIRVFISSTFNDLDEERRYLINTVFPELRVLAAERGVSITEIDLRWGITEEEAKQGKVVEMCLDEIEAAIPFFIGIIGENYGWCPPESIFSINPSLDKKYGSWLHEDMRRRLGMTEIEMQYGVLRRGETINANFFVKTVPNEKRPKPLLRLIDSIYTDGRYPVYDFSSKEEIGFRIRESFIRILEDTFPVESDETAFGINSRICQAIIFEKNKQYFQAGDCLEKLIDFVEDDSKDEVVIDGEGKTTVLCAFSSIIHNKQRFKCIPIIIGSTADLSKKDGIIRHINTGIRKLYNIPDVFLPSLERIDRDIDEEMEFLFSKISSSKPMIIVLDGVNNLSKENYDNTCSWLPRVHNGVKYVFSTNTDDSSFSALKARGAISYTISRFNDCECEEYIKNYLRSKKKALDEDQLSKVVHSPIRQTIKGLTLLLDELIYSGRFDNLYSLIVRYFCSCSSIEEVYENILVRLSDDYGQTTITKLLGILTACSNGLYESELRELMGFSHIRWAQFYQSIKTIVHVSEGTIKLQPLVFKNSVLPSEIMVVQLTNYFGLQRDTLRGKEVLANISYCTKNSKDLLSILTNGDFIFDSFKHPDKNAKMAQYWTWLLQESNVMLSPESVLNQLSFGNNDSCLVLSVLSEFFVQVLHEPEYSKVFAEEALKQNIETTDIPVIVGISNAYHTLAVLEYQHSRYKSARQFYIKAVEVLNRIPLSFDRLSLSKASLFSEAAECAAENGDFKIAKDYIKAAYTVVVNLYGETSVHSVHILGRMAYIHRLCKELPRAEELYKDAILKAKQLFGDDSPLELSYSIQLSFTLLELHKIEESFILAEHVLDIATKNGKQDLVRVAYNAMGSGYSKKRLYEQSLACNKNALDLSRQLYGELSNVTAQAYHNLGITYDNLNEFKASYDCKTKALDIRTRLFGKNHIKTASSLNGIGSYFFREGDYSKALDYQKDALEIRELCYGRYSSALPESYSNVVRCYNALKQYDSALNYATIGLDICLKVYGEKHLETADAYCDLGDTYANIKDVKKSTLNHVTAFSIYSEFYNKIDSRLEHIYYELIHDYWEMGQLEQALSFAEMNIECCLANHTSPSVTIAEAYHYKGTILAHMGQFINAVQVLASALNSLQGINSPLIMKIHMEIMTYTMMINKS